MLGLDDRLMVRHVASRAKVLDDGEVAIETVALRHAEMIVSAEAVHLEERLPRRRQ